MPDSCGQISTGGAERSLSTVYCCGHFQLSIKNSLTSAEKDLTEMMEKAETERDRDQTNLGHLWIEPPHFIGLVCRVYVRDLRPPQSMGSEIRGV